MVFCGTDGKQCCPKNSITGGECNLSGRKKIDPKTVYEEGETIYSGGDKSTNVNRSEPMGTLRGTVGLENPTPRNHDFMSWDSCWGGHRTDYLSTCFKKNNDPTTEDVDEYWTRCGYGDAIKTRSLIGEDKEDNNFYFEAENQSNITRGDIIGSDFLFPDNIPGVCNNIAFDPPPGYIHVESGATESRCNFFEEIKSQGNIRNSTKNGVTNNWYQCSSNTLKAADLGLGESGCDWSQPWATDDHIFFQQGQEDDLIVIPPNAQACRYKYRKDWALPMHGSPPRFTTEPVQGEWDLEPSSSPSSHFYKDVVGSIVYPINRMKCCINVSDSGDWGGDKKPGDDPWIPEQSDTWDSDNRKRIDKNECPIIGLDTYTNKEIEDGAGVYDPKSNVCARYYPDQDGPDTPDNWCSYRIMSDNFFTGVGRLLSVTAEGQLQQLDQTKYEKFINLLTDKNCVDWLKLDFNEHFEPDSTSDKRPRSAALAIKLADFFVWVSKHLADPRLTPLISQNLDYVDDRLDLLQQPDKKTYFGSSRAVDSRDHSHPTIYGADNIKQTGLCKGDETIAPKYIGDYDLWTIGASILPMVSASASSRTTRVGVCEAGKIAVESLSRPDPVQDPEGSSSYQMFMDLDCEDIDERCNLDGRLPCEDKFYSRTILGQEYTFPCVKYDNNRKSPRGLIYPSESTLSPTGCGYSDPDIVTPVTDLTITEAAEERKCAGDARDKEHCCNTQNGADRDIRGEIISNAALTKESSLSLLQKNFHAGYNLGKFLNFLTTAAAGAFLHYGGGQTQKHAEFIKNMKIFSNRSDIFNWKNEFDANNGDYNKKYNKLLETRYGKMCHCFWSYNVKYDTDKPGAPTTDTDGEFPAWCMDTDLPHSCTKYNFGNLNETLNPVARIYKGTMMIDQCSSMGKDGKCDGADGCSLSPTMQTYCTPGSTTDNSESISTVTSALIDAFSSNDAYLNREIKKDNYCWNYGCRDNNEDYTHDGGLQAEVYGLNTKHSQEYNTSPQCRDTSICQSTCYQQQLVAAQNIIINTKNPTGGINQDASCDLGSPGPGGSMNCYIGVNGDPSMAPVAGGGGNYAPPGGAPPPPSPPPSPSPSPSPGTETDLIGVIIRVFFVIGLIIAIAVWWWKWGPKNKDAAGEPGKFIENSLSSE